MPGPEPAGSSTGAEADRLGPGADRRTSWQEVDRSSTEAEADSRLRAVGALGVARRCSIAAARRRCMQPAVWGHSSMTSLVHFFGKT